MLTDLLYFLTNEKKGFITTGDGTCFMWDKIIVHTKNIKSWFSSICYLVYPPLSVCIALYVE